MKHNLEYAKLSGIEPPAALTGAEEEARRKVAMIRDKKGELSGRMEAAEGKISDLVTREAAALVENGGDSKLARKRELAEGRITSSTALLSELERFEEKAMGELSQAEADLGAFISNRLAEMRRCRREHLDIVMAERARQLGNLRAGEVVQSSRPARNSKSRIATCEVCQQDIGIFDPKTICLPIRAEHFEKLPRDSYPPFIPGATIEYFKCKRCGKRPFGEFDRILTNAGFFVVDSHEESQGHNTDKQGESNA